jgi:nucleoid-associated protein YgaU
MQRFWSVAAIAILAASVPVVSTQPGQCLRQPAAGANVPYGFAVYRTDRVCTPYDLAERFYGHGYMAYKIVEANQLLLRSDKTFPAGVDLVIPPDNKGRTVPERLLKNDQYY